MVQWGIREKATKHYDCSQNSIDRARNNGMLKSSKGLCGVKVYLIHLDKFYKKHFENPIEAKITPQKIKEMNHSDIALKMKNMPVINFERDGSDGDSVQGFLRNKWRS